MAITNSTAVMRGTAPAWPVRTRIAWGFLVAGSLMTAFLASRYYSLDPDTYFPRQRLIYDDKTLALIIHISGMMFALLAGPFQFLRKLRVRRPRLHRLLGKAYVGGALIGGLGGLYMAQYSASGTPSDLGFSYLAIAVLATTTIAFLRIVRGQVRSHREWMTRSFALIFAAVTLRLYLSGLEAAFGEHLGYAIDAWACWIPNLAVAEWLIRSRIRRAT
jgi:uncharacterized membrane protein